MVGLVVCLYTWDERSNRVLHSYICGFFLIYIYICITCGVLHVEKRNARQRTSSPRPPKEFANREEVYGGERGRKEREGRDATSMIPRVIIIMRISMYVYLFIIFIFIMMYVRVRDQTLHCRLNNKMRSHVNILKTYHKSYVNRSRRMCVRNSVSVLSVRVYACVRACEYLYVCSFMFVTQCAFYDAFYKSRDD